MFQKILGCVLLSIGLIYGAVLVRSCVKDKEGVVSAKGKFRFLAPLEFVVFVIASLGVSDYLLNTLATSHFRLTRDEELPGTLICSGVVPGSIFAFSMLRADNPVDMVTLAFCSVAVIIGSFIGSGIVQRMDGKLIKKIMCGALVVSLVFVVIKIIVSAGATGTAVGVRGVKLGLAAFLCLLTGIVNRFGIPMKPTWTAIFLLLGFSPMATLTMILIIGSLTPISGGISVVKSGLYQKKIVLSALTFGSLGAIVGTALAISIPALVLNVVLIAVMLIAIVSMMRSK